MGAEAVQDRAFLQLNRGDRLQTAHFFQVLPVPDTTDVAELSLLERAHYYRLLGEDAARQAEAAPDEPMRSAYGFLAEHWLKLAQATEEAAGMKDVAIPSWEFATQHSARDEF